MIFSVKGKCPKPTRRTEHFLHLWWESNPLSPPWQGGMQSLHRTGNKIFSHYQIYFTFYFCRVTGTRIRSRCIPNAEIFQLIYHPINEFLCFPYKRFYEILTISSWGQTHNRNGDSNLQDSCYCHFNYSALLCDRFASNEYLFLFRESRRPTTLLPQMSYLRYYFTTYLELWFFIVLVYFNSVHLMALCTTNLLLHTV